MLKQNKNISELINDYTKICDTLLYTSPEQIQKTTSHLQQSISRHFGYTGKIHTKDDLSIKNDWLNKSRPHFPAKTSGTTSGQSFNYLIDSQFYQFVEFNCRYQKIIDEFKVNCQNILFLLKTQTGKKQNIKNKNNAPSLNSHGTTGTYTHYLEWSNNLVDDMDIITKYLDDNKIDVVLTDGSVVNVLARYIKKHNLKNKICTLLSSTNEKLNSEDANFLLSNGNINYWCDHMRCWDGGAAFMTCPFYTRHLLENLSYVSSKDEKLISTDYFNLASPFIDYWNGDYCSLDDNYQLCACGRWYRNFELSRCRDWSVHGITSTEIKNRIQALKIHGIRQVRCDDRNITIISHQPISANNQQKILEQLTNFTINFVNE